MKFVRKDKLKKKTIIFVPSKAIIVVYSLKQMNGKNILQLNFAYKTSKIISKKIRKKTMGTKTITNTKLSYPCQKILTRKKSKIEEAHKIENQFNYYMSKTITQKLYLYEPQNEGAHFQSQLCNLREKNNRKFGILI